MRFVGGRGSMEGFLSPAFIGPRLLTSESVSGAAGTREVVVVAGEHCGGLSPMSELREVSHAGAQATEVTQGVRAQDANFKQKRPRLAARAFPSPSRGGARAMEWDE